MSLHLFSAGGLVAAATLLLACAAHAPTSSVPLPRRMSLQEQTAIYIAVLREAEQRTVQRQPRGVLLLADDFLDGHLLRGLVDSGAVAGLCRTQGDLCANGVRGLTATVAPADVLGQDSVAVFVQVRPRQALGDQVWLIAPVGGFWQFTLVRHNGLWRVVLARTVSEPACRLTRACSGRAPGP